MAKKSDDDLRQIVQQEVGSAAAWADSAIRAEQERNLRYYLGMPDGNEVQGRSQVLSWDVFEIVESAMPSFLEPFFAGDTIGEFQPRKMGDEAYCDQATEYVNHLIKDENRGFLLFNTWLKDCLISKVGVVRASWQTEEPKRVSFGGLDDAQMTQLGMDPDSQIIEHSAHPVPGLPALNPAQLIQLGGQVPMLHDVTVLQKQSGCVKIENVRPERFIVSRGAKSIDTARCVGEFVSYTRSDLREMGYKAQADSVSSFEDLMSIGGANGSEVLRDGDGASVRELVDSADPSMEEVVLFRGFVKADVDGDGIAEYRSVLVGGNEVLENEEAEWHDYCVLTPIPIPHRVVGMGYADPAVDIQDVKTSLTRNYLDSLYQANRPRTYVNMAAGVNLDDLLNTRIGGVVRGKAPPGEAIAPLQTTLVSRDALEGIEMAETMRESRLGITRYNQGLDADTLNKTATGVRSITSAADKRLKMTLRVLAETGVRDLFRLLLKIVTKYQDRPAVVRMRGQWVTFNPAQWSPDMDCVVAVGLGTGDPTENIMMLQQFGQYMQMAIPFGVVTPQNIYQFGLMLAKNAKIRGADQRLITDPGQGQPQQQQQQPNPEMVKLQGQMQMKQMDMQADAQKFQAQAQFDATEKDKDRATQLQIVSIQEQNKMRMELMELAAGMLSAAVAPTQAPTNLSDGTTIDQSAQSPGVTPQRLAAAMQMIDQLAGRLGAD
jgi:hypothetical protein